MFQIIATNEITHRVSRFNPQTQRSEVIQTILPAGRVIAEHQSEETVVKHCEKLRRCHAGVRFYTTETQ